MMVEVPMSSSAGTSTSVNMGSTLAVFLCTSSMVYKYSLIQVISDDTYCPKKNFEIINNITFYLFVFEYYYICM